MEESVIISVEGTQRFLGEEAQTVQVVTEGIMKREGDTLLLRYEESEVTGMEGTTTTFFVKGDRVELVRSGTIQSKMVFEKGQKDVSLYDVGFGALTIGVKARRMKNELGPMGGRLEISYGIEIEEQTKGLNSFVIDVRKQESAITQ